MFARDPVIAFFVHRAEMGHENAGVGVAPRDFVDLGELMVLTESVEKNWEAPLIGGLIVPNRAPQAHGAVVQ